MTNIRISQLPTAPSAISGSELVPIVQNGQTVQTTVYNLVNSPTQTQTYLTINNEPSLPNSQRLVGGLGLGTSSGGAQGQYSIFLNGVSGSLENASLGIVVKNTSNSVINRQLVITGSGLSITNGSGVGGNPTIGLSGLPLALASLGGSGFISTNGSTLSTNVLTGTTNQISISGGDGSSTPTISLANNPVIPGVGSATLPSGSTAQRLGSYGAIRFNTDTQVFEGFISTGWQQFSLTGGVTSFQTSLSGLTPSSPSSGVVNLSGTLNPASGGTGATSLTGYVYGNGTSTFTASTTIPTTNLSGTISNAQLANSTITINSNSISLGGSINVGTVTSVSATAPISSSGGNTPTLSITQASSSTNGYLSSSDWNTFNSKGTGSVTSVSGTGSVNGITLTGNVTTSGSLTLGGTLSNIQNTQLANSSITINGSNIALGGTATVTANTPNTLTIGSGLSGGSFNGSSAVTIALANTTVTVGTYGSATSIPQFTVNSQGQITSATSFSLASNVVSSFSAGTTGLTPSSATTGAITLGGTLSVSNGGTGVTSSSGANSVMLRDANQNTSINNLFLGFTTVVSAGTTTILTAASATDYLITGSTSQTIQLPDATTLPNGAEYSFNNNSSAGSVTITNNSGTTIATVGSGGYVVITLLVNSTAAGTWDKHYEVPSNVTWTTNTLSYPGSITSATWNGVVVGTLYGGTGTNVGVSGGAF
jgi:trimeric autotransporter adhesin